MVFRYRFDILPGSSRSSQYVETTSLALAAVPGEGFRVYTNLFGVSNPSA
jgi:hypothetical protein